MSYLTVAQTESQRERVASEHLKRRGFEVYLPRIKTRRTQIEPLFPGYIFVRVIEIWYPIKATVGVVRVLLAGDEPARLREDVLREIQAREDHRGFVRLPKRGPARGQKVRVLRGMFRDHIGVYDGQCRKDRERVLLEILGRMVAVELSPQDLQFAS